MVQQVPPIKHTWTTDAEVRQRAQTNSGNRARLRAAMGRLVSGENVTAVFTGGSISAGMGAYDGLRFTNWAERIMKQTLGPKLIVVNGAMGEGHGKARGICEGEGLSVMLPVVSRWDVLVVHVRVLQRPYSQGGRHRVRRVHAE